MYAAKLCPEEAHLLTSFLCDSIDDGYSILTWNGLSFDFPVLLEEITHPYYRERIPIIARKHHIDPGFQMFCEKGFLCGLQVACKGMGLQGKTEGMHGAAAPVMWAESREAQDKVLEYVAQDVRATLELYEAILDRGVLYWVTKSGSLGTWVPQFRENPDGSPRMLTVEECLELPEPDVSWMKEPWPRSKFAGWLTF
jgi:uncharacterized protein YprB with RNaseH-like and TPR domain